MISVAVVIVDRSSRCDHVGRYDWVAFVIIGRPDMDPLLASLCRSRRKSSGVFSLRDAAWCRAALITYLTTNSYSHLSYILSHQSLLPNN